MAQTKLWDKTALPGEEILLTTGRRIPQDSIFVSFAGVPADIIAVTADSVRVLVPKGKVGPLNITLSIGTKKERLPFTLLAYPAKRVYFQNKNGRLLKIREEMELDGSSNEDETARYYAFDMMDKNDHKVATGTSFSSEEKEVFGGASDQITKQHNNSDSYFSVVIPNEKGRFKMNFYRIPNDTDSLANKMLDKTKPATFYISNQ